MAFKPPDGQAKQPARDNAQTVSLAAESHDTVQKPFHQTRLGRLPPELREQVLIELLATPPPYAGHDFAATSSRQKTSLKAPQKFVHIKASWYHVTRTCRQIYLEAHPLFFASKAYYLASAKESKIFLQGIYSRQTFRYETITTLCLKDLVECSARFSKEEIDRIFSDPTEYLARSFTRQELEAQTDKQIRASIFVPLGRLKNLKALGLCFSVGEEMEHVNFLYGLTGLMRGLVEFLDPHRWLIRPQDAEDVWRTQYACFYNADYAMDKNGENIPYDLCLIEREVTDIDSRAPGLQEGDERYVEVLLHRSARQDSSQGSLYGYEIEIEWASASDHSDVENQNSPEAQLEISQDPIEPIESTALAETSEEDISMAEIEPESNRIDQSSFLGLQNETSPSIPPDTNTDQGEDHTVLHPASEETSSTQPENQSNRQFEDPLPKKLITMAHNAPTGPGSNRLFLLDTDDEDDEVQANTKPRTQASQMVNSQYDDEFYGESATEADQTQYDLKEKRKGLSRRTKIKHGLSQKKQPLLDVLDTPNPYTEEEMESFEKWQQLAISGNQQQTKKDFHKEANASSPLGKRQGQNVEGSRVASKTATPEESRPSPASSNQAELPSKSVQMGGVFILILLLLILNFRTGRLSNTRRDETASDQQ